MCPPWIAVEFEEHPKNMVDTIFKWGVASRFRVRCAKYIMTIVTCAALYEDESSGYTVCFSLPKVAIVNTIGTRLIPGPTNGTPG